MPPAEAEAAYYRQLGNWSSPRSRRNSQPLTSETPAAVPIQLIQVTSAALDVVKMGSFVYYVT